MSNDGYVVAVVGATGAVGREMLETLEQRQFPVRELRAMAEAWQPWRSVAARLFWHYYRIVPI